MTEYPRPIATVDVVTLRLVADVLEVGLLRRDAPDEPHHGRLALPGGFVRVGEDTDLDAAARRVLRHKGGTSAGYIEQLGTRGDAHRDPRGWSLSVAYAALIDATAVSGLAFHPAETPPELAFDHASILDDALYRLRSKARYSALPLFLLTPPFTIGDAHHVYELVLGETLDAANFRRKLFAQNVLEPVGRRQEIGPPTTTYRLAAGAKVTFRRPIVQ